MGELYTLQPGLETDNDMVVIWNTRDGYTPVTVNEKVS